MLWVPLSCPLAFEDSYAGKGVVVPGSADGQESSVKEEDRAAAVMQGALQACLTPSELLGVLMGAEQTVTGTSSGGFTGGPAVKQCQVVASAADVKALQAVRQALPTSR